MLKSDTITALIICGAIGLFILWIIVLRTMNMDANEPAHPSKREKKRQAEERKRISFLWMTLVIFIASAFIAIFVNSIIGITIGILVELLLITSKSWSYRGRVKKNDPNQDISWLANGNPSDWDEGEGG